MCTLSQAVQMGYCDVQDLEPLDSNLLLELVPYWTVQSGTNRDETGNVSHVSTWDKYEKFDSLNRLVSQEIFISKQTFLDGKVIATSHEKEFSSWEYDSQGNYYETREEREEIFSSRPAFSSELFVRLLVGMSSQPKFKVVGMISQFTGWCCEGIREFLHKRQISATTAGICAGVLAGKAMWEAEKVFNSLLE